MLHLHRQQADDLAGGGTAGRRAGPPGKDLPVHRKLSAVVQVDPDGRYVRVDVTGALTEVNQQALHPVLQRARTALPGARVVVDLRCVHGLEPAAVDLLRWSFDQDGPGGGPLEIHAPEELPEQAPAAVRDARRRMRAKLLQRQGAEPPGPGLAPAL